MNRVSTKATLLCLALCSVLLGGSLALGDDGKPKQPVLKRIDPNRLKGMKSAIADLEQNRLRQKMVPPPASPWWEEYLRLIKEQCGVEIVYVETRDLSGNELTEMVGYNDLMLLEIEHRNGKGILEKLAKKAEADYLKARKEKK